MQAVRYDNYGGLDVLGVREVPRPEPGPGQVLVAVRAAGINPGETKIREGVLADRWPSTFPSGQGSDLAGVVAELGDGVTEFTLGDEVIGFVHTRSSQAEFVVVEAEHLAPKPENVPWEVAGALFVAGSTAWAAVRAVVQPGDTVVVSGAAGGVGSIAVQLAALAGAQVIGLASTANHAWLAAHSVTPIAYGDGVHERISAAAEKVNSFIDTYGDGYVDLALSLGVPTDRIDTVIDFAAAEKYGVKTDGNAVGSRAEVLAELAALIERGELEIPIAAVYPLAEVGNAFAELERGHTHGKIVLVP